MLRVFQILASRFALAASLAGLAVLAAAGCGQRGPLFLPGDGPGTARATLPQTLRPGAMFTPPAVPAPLTTLPTPPPGLAASGALPAPGAAMPSLPSTAAPGPLPAVVADQPSVPVLARSPVPVPATTP